MTQIIVNRDEHIEYALRRFKRKVSQAGIFLDLKKNRSFETPAQKLKRKQLARHKQRRKYNKYKTF